MGVVSLRQCCAQESIEADEKKEVMRRGGCVTRRTGARQGAKRKSWRTVRAAGLTRNGCVVALLTRFLE